MQYCHEPVKVGWPAVCFHQILLWFDPHLATGYTLLSKSQESNLLVRLEWQSDLFGVTARSGARRSSRRDHGRDDLYHSGPLETQTNESSLFL